VPFDIRRRIGEELRSAILALAASRRCRGLYSEENAPFAIER
jgi:hypothetical protein